MVRMSSLTQDYAGARSQITLTQAPAWADYGVGMADMTKEPDGYWYIIFEAFSGATGACGRTDTATTVGIARSTDVRTWTVRQTPLLRGRDGKSCGYDMTAWLPTSQGLSVVTPNDPPENVPLVRWNVDAKTAPVNAASRSTPTVSSWTPRHPDLDTPNRLTRDVRANRVTRPRSFTGLAPAFTG